MSGKTRIAAFSMRTVVVSGFALALMLVLDVRPQAQSAQALAAAHRRLLPLFELAGVVFTDADEASGRLVVGVMDREIDGLVRAQLARLGVSDTVDLVETEPIERVATLRDKVRPVSGGLQIRYSQYVCSLGFNAWRDGVAGYVTAAHCSTNQGAVDGTKHYQPLNQVADEYIGTEVSDPAFFRNVNGCPRGKRCRYSDSNFSEGASGVLFSFGRLARTTGPNNGSLAIDPANGEFVISAEGPAARGQTANKIGRSTGWTQGAVLRTCVNTSVSGTNVVLLCQDFVENKNATIVAGGDSGAPVFSVNGNGTVTLLGNLWGGNSSGSQFVYSPIANVEYELGALSTF
jgi:hypothetical protein